MIRVLGYFAPVAVFIALALLLYSGLGKDPTRLPSVLIGRELPAFALPELNDPERTVTHQELAGQVHLVSVFASWCPSCRDQHPALHALSQHYGLPLLGLNYKDQREDALRWLRQFGNPYDVIAVDSSGRTGIELGVTAAPETFLVDAQGRIRYKYIGPISRASIDDTLRPMIEQLRAEAADGQR